MAKPEFRRIPAIKVGQWLRAWNGVKFDASKHRTKPEPHFFMFSLPATELRSLCGIFRRETRGVKPRAADLGIQRQHDPERSDEITQFVENGYPWSTLSAAKRQSGKYDDLRKPGWLPTAIVINILGKDDMREEKSVASKDVVTVRDNGSVCEILLPYKEWSRDWEPEETPPFEVIDGQHRLWAFDPQKSATAGFELPVVAFHSLDISWQAYLFWTINIKPKRINPSLAFDLYPLLRGEDWLERAEEHIVYRDTRSQELTEVLWSHPKSPWYDRINMLGEKQNPWVTQAAWIRSLSASFVKAWDRRQGRSGGLFGERIGEEGEVLGWSRAQQAAFLIYAWSELRAAIHHSEEPWVESLRQDVKSRELRKLENEPGFYSVHSLIVTDQGVRAFLQAVNDICYLLAPRLKLHEWFVRLASGPIQEDAITSAVKTLEDQSVSKTVQRIAARLASFDWRTSSAPGLNEQDRRLKLAFRGGSGYKELRRQLLSHLAGAGSDVGRSAQRLLAEIR